MMNPELKAKWVEALRSGEFKQTRGKLKINDRYCCLGVLCSVAGVEIKDYYTHVPFQAATKIGLGPADESDLIDQNDQDKKSFDEIADYIEANL